VTRFGHVRTKVRTSGAQKKKSRCKQDFAKLSSRKICELPQHHDLVQGRAALDRVDVPQVDRRFQLDLKWEKDRGMPVIVPNLVKFSGNEDSLPLQGIF
jgi:hypothetical protein